MKSAITLFALFFISICSYSQCWEKLGYPIGYRSDQYLLNEEGDLYRIPVYSGPGYLSLFDTTGNWRDIYQGQYLYASYGIKEDGSLWAWGQNVGGAVGNGTTDTVPKPIKIDDGPWDYVDQFEGYCMGRKSDSSIWHWGHDSLLVPTLLTEGTQFKDAEPVAQKMLLLGNDGDLYQWKWGGEITRMTTGRGYSAMIVNGFDIWCKKADGTYRKNSYGFDDFTEKPDVPVYDFDDYHLILDARHGDAFGIHKQDSTLQRFSGFFGAFKPDSIYCSYDSTFVLEHHWKSASQCGIQEMYALDTTNQLWYGGNFWDTSYVSPIVYDSTYGNICGSTHAFIHFTYSDTCGGGNPAYDVGVTIEPGNLYRRTNFWGEINLNNLEDGTYSVSLDTTESGLVANCEMSKSITIQDGKLVGDSWTMYAREKNPCLRPVINVVTTRARSCAASTIYVRAAHDINSYIEGENLSIILKVDSLYMVDSANVDYTELGNNEFLISNVTLTKGEILDYRFFAFLDCEAPINKTLVNSAEFIDLNNCAISSTSPNSDSTCTGDWDEPSLTVSNDCIEDTAYFVISNVGTGDMDCISRIRIDTNGYFSHWDSIQLAAGESYTMSFVPEGSTIYVSAEQHPGHPANSRPDAFVEACGSLDYNHPFARAKSSTDDIERYKDIDLISVRNSYDPNQKLGYPLGLGDEDLIEQNQDLEYRIDFQNTGNDTAYTVVVRDTITEELNLKSLTPLVGSHSYTFSFVGPRVAEWRFENINLLDSANHEEESKGFFTFSIKQNNDLPIGTDITNRVGIYFDFNDPIITNISHHKIGDISGMVNVAEHFGHLNNNLISIYPNPSGGFITIAADTDINKLHYSIMDIEGRLVLEGTISGTSQKVDISKLAKGVYLIQIGTYQPMKVVKM